MGTDHLVSNSGPVDAVLVAWCPNTLRMLTTNATGHFCEGALFSINALELLWGWVNPPTSCGTTKTCIFCSYPPHAAGGGQYLPVFVLAIAKADSINLVGSAGEEATILQAKSCLFLHIQRGWLSVRGMWVGRKGWSHWGVCPRF